VGSEPYVKSPPSPLSPKAHGGKEKHINSALSNSAFAGLYAPTFIVERAFENLAITMDELLNEALLNFREGSTQRCPAQKIFYCDPLTRTLILAPPTGLDRRSGLPRHHFIAVKVKGETNPENFMREVAVLRSQVQRLARERLYACGRLGELEGATYILVAASGYAKGGLHVSKATHEFALCYIAEDVVDALRRLAQGLRNWLERRITALAEALNLHDHLYGRPIHALVSLLLEPTGIIEGFPIGVRQTLRALCSLWRSIARRLDGLKVLGGLKRIAESSAQLVRSAADAFTSLFPSMARQVAAWYYRSPIGFLSFLEALAAG